MRRTLLALSAATAMTCALVSTSANASIASYLEGIIHYNVAYSGFKAMTNNGNFSALEQRYQTTVNDLTAHNYSSQAAVCATAAQNIQNSYADVKNIFGYLEQHNSYNTHYQNGAATMCLAKYEAFLGSAQVYADNMKGQGADQIASACTRINNQAQLGATLTQNICEGNA